MRATLLASVPSCAALPTWCAREEPDRVTVRLAYRRVTLMDALWHLRRPALYVFFSVLDPQPLTRNVLHKC